MKLVDRLRGLIIFACVFLLGIAATGFSQTVTATVPAGTEPGAMAVDPVTNKIYVVNQNSNNVTVIDGATNDTTTVPVGTGPEAVAVDPVTDEIYVANTGGNNVTVIDGATNGTTTVSAGSYPIALAVDPVTNRIYVANETGSSVTVIDGATNDTATVSAESHPIALAVNPVTDKIYVANSASSNVTVIDGATNDTTLVPVGTQPLAIAVNPVTNKIYVVNRIDSSVTVIDGATNDTTLVPAGSGPTAVAVNPVTDKIYVADCGSPTVAVIDGATNDTSIVPTRAGPYAIAVNPVTNKIYVESQVDSCVTVIDGATNDTTTASVGSLPYGVAVNPVTDEIYVANRNSNNVTVIDGATNDTATVSAGYVSQAVAVNPVTNKIYVANESSNDVTMIDGATNSTATVSAGSYPWAVAVNPVTNEIYVPNYGSSNVTIIDGATNDTTTVPAGTEPCAVAVNPVTNRVYVANYESNNVTVIDGATNTTTLVPAGTGPTAVAVDPATDKIYVANQLSNNVTVIDGATNSTATVSAGSYPYAVAVNPVTDKIYVANGASDNVTVIDGATNTRTTVSTGIQSVRVAVNAVTDKIYVANNQDNNVTVIDGATNDTTVVPAGNEPDGLAVNPVTNKIYVANGLGNNVMVIDGATNHTTTVSSGREPLAVAVNPVTNKVYVVAESSMSGNGNNITVLTEQAVQSIPLATSITALTNNETTGVTPTFDFNTSSSYSPTAPPVQGVYYAVDTWQNAWQKASGSGSSYSCTTGTLSAGTHVIYAFATDGQEATSINTGYGTSPIIGGIAAYAFDVVAPPVPVLTSPANNSVNLPVDDTLQVNSSAGATSYNWQVSVSPTFSSTVVDDSTTGTTNSVILSKGTKYYWRVQAVGSAGASVYSEPDSFTTIVAPPVLAYPSDNATNQASSLALKVDFAAGATGYHWQVSTNSAFSSFVYNDSTTGVNDTAHVVSLAPATKYYWQVQAFDAGGTSPYVGPDSFTTMAAPPSPTLAYPSNNATNQPTSLTLKVDTTAGATGYHWQVSTGPAFSSFVCNDSTTGSKDTVQAVTLASGTKYFWRVQAYNIGGASSYAGPDSLTTKSSSVAPPTPALCYPANNATGIPTEGLVLKCFTTSPYTNYSFVLSTDPSFSTVIAQRSEAPDTTFEVDSLSGLTKYYWRVSGVGSGYASLSLTDSFTTAVGVPVQASFASWAVNEPPTLTLEVDSVAGATGYHWEVSVSPTFSTTVVDDSTMGINDTTEGVTLASGQKYYWRVQAFSAGGAGSYTAIDSFSVMSVPDVPLLAYPANNASYQPADSLALKWHSVSADTGYVCEVSDSTSFSSLVVMQDTTRDTTMTVISLKNLRKYYWRVCSYNAGGMSAFTAIDSFTTIIAAPSAPNPRYPIGATGEPRIAAFKWEPSENALRYRLQVAKADSLDSLGGFMRAYVVFDTTLSDTTDTLSTPLQADVKYYWHVSAIDTGGVGAYSAVEEFATGTGLTVVDEISGVPKEYRLFQNYPNPFNPTTVIGYQLPVNSRVTLKVYDILGREVATLVDGEQNAGSYKVTFDGERYASGVYFYRFVADGTNGRQFVAIRKFMMVK